jgi:RNA-directed DNA polymerase
MYQKIDKRGLGIPVVQALVKLALEPEWEACFEPNSYGFRPGRSAHDAVEAIYRTSNQKPKFVLDADIAKCFDRINHQALLNKLHTYPTMRRIIRAWLKAGVMDGVEQRHRRVNASGTSCQPSCTAASYTGCKHRKAEYASLTAGLVPSA